MIHTQTITPGEPSPSVEMLGIDLVSLAPNNEDEPYAVKRGSRTTNHSHNFAEMLASSVLGI